MRKILVIGMTSIAGGVESFLMNYYRRLNKTHVLFDFLCPSVEKIAYADEIEKSSNIYYIIPKTKNPFEHKRQLGVFFMGHKGEYDAVWANLNSLMNIDYLKIARKYGINHIIVHSHNSNNMGSTLQKVMHNLNRRHIEKIATDYWACSKNAAEWFYPKELLDRVRIIYNAIDIKKYAFDEVKRNHYRKENDLDDKKVIGHIGRLHFQKNQSFMLDVFKKLYSTDSSYRLILIGTGPDQKMLEDKVSALEIGNAVTFLGQQSDIAGWLSTFDLFLFPSLFEGLSIAGLEAQANGIPIVCSDTAIGEEGLINRNVKRLPLDLPIEKWSDEVDYSIGIGRLKKDDIADKFCERGFDIEREAQKLADFFERM